MIHRTPRLRPRVGFVDVVVIGAGHAGLAMSRHLSQNSIDHVVLERGEVANSWRHERWDSLRLLTPNWQTRLPDCKYSGADPDAYMSMPEVIGFIERYAKLIDAPVRTGTTVKSVTSCDAGYRVTTDQGQWKCRALVIASGAHAIPTVPNCGAALPDSVLTLTAKDYRNPNPLDASGVLIVGASATGLQLADEIQRSGRHVTLAVGEHIRMPRTYRGSDIQWWLDTIGLLNERYDEVDDIARARNVPSPQLIGSPRRETLDLNALTDRGVEIVGRFAGVNDARALFSGSLHNQCAMADLKLQRLLGRIDDWIERNGNPGTVAPAMRLAPTRVAATPRLSIDLKRDRIGTVIWATGYRPDYNWLQVPVFDRKHRLRHEGGIVDAPGMYVLGLNFMRRRKSSFIHGAEDDVHDLGGHLALHLQRQHARAHAFTVGRIASGL